MRTWLTMPVAVAVALATASSGRAEFEFSFDVLETFADAGGFPVSGGGPIVVEQQEQTGVGFDTLRSELDSNTLTARGASTLDSSFDGTKLRIVASLDQLQAERTDTSYGSVFAQGESYFQIWVMPRGQAYEYTCRVTQAFDDGLVPVFGADPGASLTLFTVLQGVGGGPNGDRGDWFFSGVLPPGDYQWYGGISAAVASEGAPLGPLGGSVLVDVEFLPVPTDRTWIGPDGGPFGQPGHWDPAGTPGVEDRVLFHTPADGDEAVVFDQPATTARLLVTAPPDRQSSQRVFRLGGHTYTLTREWNDQVGASATIGDQGSGIARLRVMNGRVDARDAELGRAGYGELAVGVDATWSAFQHMISVGSNGGGRLEVANGGRVEHGHGFAGQNPGSNGDVVVRGVHPIEPSRPSAWLVTGWFGLGTGGEGSLTVEQGASAEIGKCDLGASPGSRGRVELSGTNSQWRLLAPFEASLVVGQRGSGRVSVSQGAMLFSEGEARLGEAEGATGVIELSDRATPDGVIELPTLECMQHLTIGYGGRGDLQLSSRAWAVVRGAVVVGTDPDTPPEEGSGIRIAGADSVLEVQGKDGEGSVIGLEVGRRGAGNSLHITDGGRVETQYATTIGGAEGEGFLKVEGEDSAVAARFLLEVGRDSPGRVEIADGGRVVVDGSAYAPDLAEHVKGLAYIGVRSEGEVTVRSGSGRVSVLETQAQLALGVLEGQGHGRLIVEQGGLVISRKSTSATDTAGIVARMANTTGQVIISDAGSRWEMPDGGLTVGWFGSGEMDLLEGGLVVSQHGIVGRVPGSLGQVRVLSWGETDSSWQVEGPLSIGGDLQGNAGGEGHVEVGGGGVVRSSQTVTVYAGGTIRLDGGRLAAQSGVVLHGTCTGHGVIEASVDNVDGVMQPHDLDSGAGADLEVAGEYTQRVDATLGVEIVGDGATGRILVPNGTATLDGTLAVSIRTGCVPPVNSTFELVHAAGGVLGQFASYALPMLGGEPVFEVLQDEHAVLLRTLREYRCRADLDFDLDVDSDDLRIFSDCASGPAVLIAEERCRIADLDGDRDADGDDFARIQRCQSGPGNPAEVQCAE